MSLLEIMIAITVVGVALYLINKLIPMEATIKRILNIVVILGLCIWLAYAFGLVDYLKRVKV